MTSPDTLSLAGKVAIVTGSGRWGGLGAAIAHALARNGAAVVVNYVTEATAARAEEVVDKLRSAGARATAIQANVASVEGAQKLAKETLKEFDVDHIDILVNNAGSGAGEGILIKDLPQADAEKAFAVNFFASLYVSQAVIPHMPQGGRIVNIGTIVSRLSNLPGVSVYGASKAAQDYLTGALALELGRSNGITVNTIAPGGTQTGANQQNWYPEGEMRNLVGMTLLGMTKLGERAGKAEEVADAVLLVVSDHARWITGQYIAVSGGVSFL